MKIKNNSFCCFRYHCTHNYCWRKAHFYFSDELLTTRISLKISTFSWCLDVGVSVSLNCIALVLSFSNTLYFDFNIHCPIENSKKRAFIFMTHLIIMSCGCDTPCFKIQVREKMQKIHISTKDKIKLRERCNETYQIIALANIFFKVVNILQKTNN